MWKEATWKQQEKCISSNNSILTSHEEEKPCHILHKASVPTAPQDANNPPKEDDGHGHAHETSGHPAQICSGGDTKTTWVGTVINQHHQGFITVLIQNATDLQGLQCVLVRDDLSKGDSEQGQTIN